MSGVAERLGLAAGARAWLRGAPDGLAAQLAEAGVEVEAVASAGIDVALLFVDTDADMGDAVTVVPLLAPAGRLWLFRRPAATAPTIATLRRAARDGGLVEVGHATLGDWHGLQFRVAPAA